MPADIELVPLPSVVVGVELLVVSFAPVEPPEDSLAPDDSVALSPVLVVPESPQAADTSAAVKTNQCEL
jgi:hypothetical protein